MVVSQSRPLRIGHGGASALAPANTIASFELARQHGVDMIEFDVRALEGRLVLAHTPWEGRYRRVMGLQTALECFSSAEYRGIALNVDLKHAGIEGRLLGELERFGLLDRVLISSQVPGVLDRVRRRDPSVGLGISVGGVGARLLRRWRDWRAAVLGGLAQRRWDAVMAYHGLVDAALLEAIDHRGGRLFAWTVNCPRTMAALETVGVHGITSADPRLFGAELRRPGSVLPQLVG